MDFSIFKSRLRSLIESRGIYVSVLADELGISHPTLHRYMNGSRTPDLPYVVKIAEFFNVSIDWLLGLNGDKFDVLPADVQEVANLYSLASEDDRQVVRVVLSKYKNKE